MIRPVAALASLLLLAGACTDGGDEQSGRSERRGSGELDWQDCGDDLECASLAVPLDHADPGGTTIDLAVARRPAADRNDRVGALFVNPGGPGSSAIEHLRFFVPDDAILERFDLVAVEPRGLPRSAPLDCGTNLQEIYGVDPTVEDRGDAEAMIEVSRWLARECEASAGGLLEHIGTRDVAADIDAVRAAMGEDSISFLGYSYGTALGQVYDATRPERVRAMVLDGVVDVTAGGIESATEQARGLDRALERFAADCDERAGCPLAPDALGAVDELLDRAEGGVPAPGADRDLGPGEAAIAFVPALSSPSLRPTLAEAVDAALGGDGTAMVGLADRYLGREGDTYPQRFGVYFGVSCTDFAWPDDPDAHLEVAADVAETAPRLGEAVVNDYLRCAHWPAPEQPLRDLPETPGPDGGPPVLVVSTTGDPVTPHSNAVALVDRLDEAVLLTEEGEGHTAVYGTDDCVDEAVTAYLLDPEVSAAGTVC